MSGNQFNEDRAVYDAPTYTLGQYFDAPETMPDDIRAEFKKALERLIEEAEASGPAEPFDRESFFAEMHRKPIGKA